MDGVCVRGVSVGRPRGLYSARLWCVSGSHVGHPWAVHRQPMGFPWGVRGASVGNTLCAVMVRPRGRMWAARRAPTENPWGVQGVSAGRSYGLSVGCSWAVRGLSVGCPRTAHGVAVGYPSGVRGLSTHAQPTRCPLASLKWLWADHGERMRCLGIFRRPPLRGICGAAMGCPWVAYGSPVRRPLIAHRMSAGCP